MLTHNQFTVYRKGAHLQQSWPRTSSNGAHNISTLVCQNVASIYTAISLFRLFEKELDYIVNHAKDQYIMLDLTFVDLMAKMQHKFPTVKGYIVLTDRQHMPKHSKLQHMLCYEDLLQVCVLYLLLKHHILQLCLYPLSFVTLPALTCDRLRQTEQACMHSLVTVPNMFVQV